MEAWSNPRRAWLGSGRGVCGQVALQQRAVREDLAAGGAGRALRPVRAHVHVERALLCEALGAHSALEGAHARVRDHVLQQVVAQRERSPAHGALVGLLPCGPQGTRVSAGDSRHLCPAGISLPSGNNHHPGIPVPGREIPGPPFTPQPYCLKGTPTYGLVHPLPSAQLGHPSPRPLPSHQDTTDCQGHCCSMGLASQVSRAHIKGPPLHPFLPCPQRILNSLISGHCSGDSLARPSTLTLEKTWAYLPPFCWNPGCPDPNLLATMMSPG